MTHPPEPGFLATLGSAAERPQGDPPATFQVVVAAATVATGGVLALWLGARGRSPAWVGTRVGCLLLVVACLAYFARERRQGQLDQVQAVRLRHERFLVPLVAMAAGAAALPWTPRVAAAASAAVVVLLGLVFYELFADAHGRREADCGPLTLLSTVNRQRSVAWRGALSALVFISFMVLIGTGLLAIPELTSNREQGVRAEAGSSEASTPGEAACVPGEALGLPLLARQQMILALDREGGVAGCMTAPLFESSLGIHAASTNGGYIVMGWTKDPAFPGIDDAPRGTVWWMDALEARGASSLLDQWYPGDRLDCDNGAVAVLTDSAGAVRAVVASADYDNWYVVPGSIIGAYIERSMETGQLPMPTSRAEAAIGGDVIQQLSPGEPPLVAGPDRISVDWAWANRVCEGAKPTKL